MATPDEVITEMLILLRAEAEVSEDKMKEMQRG